MDKYTRLTSEVKKYLRDKGMYERVDNTLIDELIFNVKLCDDAKDDISVRGIQVNIRKNPDDEPYYQVNQSVSIYNSAVKMITAISTRLGITVLERTKLGIVDKKDREDELSKLIG